MSRIEKITSYGPDGEALQSTKIQGWEKEEHCPVLAFPGKKYIDHCSPKSKTAYGLSVELVSVLEKYDSKSSLKGCLLDGCNKNTGKDNGVVRRLELELNRPLHWFVCLLHLLEVILRALFFCTDGKTTGPSTYAGPIGNAIKKDLTTSVSKL